MGSRSPTPLHCVIFAILILFMTSLGLAAADHLHSSSTQPVDGEISLRHRETQADESSNEQNLYGRGVLVGSYCQGGAFVVGFLNLRGLDPNTQFSGIILALSLLVRTWYLYNQQQISISEMWIALAQLLIITTPGSLLLFLSLGYKRRHWFAGRDEQRRDVMPRKVVIRGAGWSFLQVFIVLAWVNVTNLCFAGIFSFSSSNVRSDIGVTGNPIWMVRTFDSRAPVFLV
jgi:hypothetical protein